MTERHRVAESEKQMVGGSRVINAPIEAGPGNQSGECQRRFPESEAWTGIKGAMRIMQINKGMRILKHCVLDFSVQYCEKWKLVYCSKALSRRKTYIG